jgi:hypothetical protein
MQAQVDPADALRSMHDIVAPDPVSRALEGPGWVVLGVLALILAVAAVWRAVRRWKANAYRRAALRELSVIESRIGDRDASGRLSALVKRTALAARRREEIASLSGSRWLEELDSMWSRDDFRNGHGRILADAAYRGDAGESELRSAIEVTRDWIRSHRAGL